MTIGNNCSSRTKTSNVWKSVWTTTLKVSPSVVSKGERNIILEYDNVGSNKLNQSMNFSPFEFVYVLVWGEALLLRGKLFSMHDGICRKFLVSFQERWKEYIPMYNLRKPTSHIILFVTQAGLKPNGKTQEDLRKSLQLSPYSFEKIHHGIHRFS